MDKTIHTQITNMLKYEGDYILKYEKDRNTRIDRMNTIYNLKMIIDNYDELEPVLRDFFEKKYQEKKWGEERE